jgi:D-3-phosphoglycerate dehydrogenase / 2-oxoglutarate reductase
MNKYTIIVCDTIHECGLKLLKSTQDINYVYAADVDKNKLLDLIKDADVAITRSSTTVDENFLNHAIKLKCLIRAGVGYDNVDLQGCSKRGIIAMNIPTANTIAAVELTITHILSAIRKFPFAHSQLKSNRIWKREDWYGTELYGKRLGVIGFGNIGHRVALRAKSFEMDVIAYDPYIPSTKMTDLNIEHTNNFNDILKCDIITIHTPKNKETINIIDEKEIEKMKDGVVLINCARGGLYNEKALYKYLKSGKISIAGIDVFETEPANNNKLLELDNIIVTAHLGANTKESQEKISLQAAQNAIQSARKISYPNALNLPIDESKIPSFVKPYIQLIQKMSFLVAQIDKSEIKSIYITAQGDIGSYLESLSTFACVGSLSLACSDEINYVNASYIAKEKGIIIDTKSISNTSAYKNKISIKITTSNGVNTISGTIFNEDVQRIVEINGYEFDIEPKGNMILFRNSDIPGVVGKFGQILGESNINISDFRLSRKKDSALAVIIIDEHISNSLLDKLSKLEASISVAYAQI